MSLRHAAAYDIAAVRARIEGEAGPLWVDKRRDIAEASFTMHRFLRHWENETARHRLRSEMEEEVDKILYRNIELHTSSERGLIAWMFWQRNSPHFRAAMNLLPGGEYFYFCQPEKTLEDEIEFRVTVLETLLPVAFDFATMEAYRDRLKKAGNGSLTWAVRACKARCASQDGYHSSVILYFDSEEDAVYARCLV